MSTNATTRRHQELRLPIGIGPDGKPEHLTIGYLLETSWPSGKSYDVELCTTVLQPVLYQQVKAFAGKSAHVVCDKADFAKRYKAPVQVDPEASAPAENDPDQGHE